MIQRWSDLAAAETLINQKVSSQYAGAKIRLCTPALTAEEGMNF